MSPGVGRPYGAKRVCSILGIARSSFYSWRQARMNSSQPSRRPRGPVPEVDDDRLLSFIRDTIDTSPFHGEGHRKIHARIRRTKGIRVGRRRVLRLMRENHLLAPGRVPKGEPNLHEGHIVTDEPNVMWGTDGARVVTSDDGNVWVFATLEHWNAECLGWHVAEWGNRFAALEPVRQAVESQFGAACGDVARGVALRHDHGSQYTSDDFQAELRFLGIQASPAFVREPETNGVAERFFRTLKEQVIHGRVYRNVRELRDAIGQFVQTYNHHWTLEKLNYLSPTEARIAWMRSNELKAA